MVSRSTVALVGSESLLGREIRDLVSTSSPGFDLRLIADAEEKPGRLTRVGGEAAVVAGLEAANLADARAVFLAGSPESSRKALELTRGSVALIDLTGALEDQPDARLRAPLVEDGRQPAKGAVHVVAHPAAIALALFLRRLHELAPVRRSVVQILAPASEHGAAGIEELQNQTISLLSFKSMPRAVFDAQLSFNLLAQYGEEAPVALAKSELRIERHLASLLAAGGGPSAPMPSLRLVQAPVFHGYSFSAWVEFQSNPGVPALEQGLASELVDVRSKDLEPPNIVGQAGQNGIAIGAIAGDRNHPEACWFWLAADNLRLTAQNAVALADGIQ